MQKLMGRTAFVTGGASGIGLALCHAFTRAGMNVMLADIETSALDAAVSDLHALGSNVRGVVCDVADPVSVDQAAQATFQAFGNVHVVCNNAGVAAAGWTDLISLDDWRWVLDVNLMGVVHGIRAFLPHIRGHGEGGHIVNTAFMAGLVAGIGLSPYVASKFAVVGISEGLAMRLRSDNIGVTVVCPGFVRTRIGGSGRNRQQRFGQARVLDPSSGNAAVMAEIRRLIEAGIDPEKVAARVLSAVQENELYVFTHPEERQELDDRFAAIRQAMDKSLR